MPIPLKPPPGSHGRPVLSHLGLEFVKEAHQAQYPIATMCRALEVSKIRYYASLKRASSPRAPEDATLAERIHDLVSMFRRICSLPSSSLRYELLY